MDAIHITVNATGADRADLADTLRRIADEVEDDKTLSSIGFDVARPTRRYHYTTTTGYGAALSAHAALAAVVSTMEETERHVPLADMTEGDYLADLARDLGRDYPGQAREGIERRAEKEGPR